MNSFPSSHHLHPNYLAFFYWNNYRLSGILYFVFVRKEEGEEELKNNMARPLLSSCGCCSR